MFSSISSPVGSSRQGAPLTFFTRSSLFGMLLLALSALSAGAEVKLHSLFTDHMVLQRGRPIPIWGRAADGEEITVTFRGKSVKTTAANGQWRLDLPKQKEGGPEELVVKGKSDTVTIKDVLVGEVWICSGQSNMEFGLGSSFQSKDDIDAATNKWLRLYTVPKLKSMEPVDSIPSAWVETSPKEAARFSAVGYYFGRDLQKALNVPVGVIHTSWGGSPAEVWMSKDVLEGNPEYLKNIVEPGKVNYKKYEESQVAFKAEQDKAKQEGKTFSKRAPFPPWRPTELYNGMIAPLLPYAIAGAIWYQGESNAGRAFEYRTLMADMIKNWRTKWKQGDFPFYQVQLAPFDKGRKRTLESISEFPVESDWAELREAQNIVAQKLPNVGVAVITDVGDKDDIHPNRKEPVGHRLAVLALDKTYHQKVQGSGPVYKSMKISGEKIIVNFDEAGSGLVARDGELKGFAIAGEDAKFVWGQAKIINNHQVEVTSPSVTKPVAVRYGWSDFPIVNLWNKEGLPASPFRTDDFQMVTRHK